MTRSPHVTRACVAAACWSLAALILAAALVCVLCAWAGAL
jgi:hypothetical protein